MYTTIHLISTITTKRRMDIQANGYFKKNLNSTSPVFRGGNKR